ncbi:hypothetical protein NE619_07605 [Anaerovorax odorimutans]|uniref:Uncharacterized protein n=1 Tax=Anaerovorax odorimutans TaxID=109327 RepID=A0ABT1RN27_9FIRM|nr:hypothetical protein [Anaerovorax odorimutans]MCQ4636591.1 hypothetical protein [Anaerovorax odorimutans]
MTEFIWIGYVSALAVLAVLCLIAAAVTAEVQLVRRKKKKAALAVIAAALLLGIGSAVFFSVVRETWCDGSVEEIDLYKDKSIIGRLNVVTDDKRQVQGFGSLMVKEGDSLKYMDLEFDRQHRMTGGTEALAYEKVLAASMKEQWVKNTMTGQSVSRQELEKLAKGFERERTYFDKERFPEALFFSNILTLVLAAIYIAGKIKERRKKTSGLDSTKIQDL